MAATVRFEVTALTPSRCVPYEDARFSAAQSTSFEGASLRPEDKVQSPVIQSVGSPTETVRDNDKIMLILSYLGILALIPYLTVKDSEYVTWHAKQGVTLGVTGFVVLTIWGFIPGLNCLSPVGALGLLVISIMGMVKGVNGIRWRIPLISTLMEKW